MSDCAGACRESVKDEWTRGTEVKWYAAGLSADSGQRRGHVQLAVALQPAVNRPGLPGSPPNSGPVYLLVFTNICRQSLREQFLDPEV